MASGSVQMRLYASLQKWRPAPVGIYDLAGISTVRDLVKANGIPESDIAIIVVNGKRGELESTLSAGDTVSLFPLIGGG